MSATTRQRSGVSGPADACLQAPRSAHAPLHSEGSGDSPATSDLCAPDGDHGGLLTIVQARLGQSVHRPGAMLTTASPGARFVCREAACVRRGHGADQPGRGLCRPGALSGGACKEEGPAGRHLSAAPLYSTSPGWASELKTHRPPWMCCHSDWTAESTPLQRLLCPPVFSPAPRRPLRNVY